VPIDNLVVDIRGKQVKCEIMTLPFYKKA
jgi:hypothetical protein